MTPQEEPNWLGTLWNVDQSLAKQAEKYLEDEKQKEAEFLNSIAVENEKKNARIRELEEALRKMTFAFKLVSPLYSGDRDIIKKSEQLLNQKQL